MPQTSIPTPRGSTPAASIQKSTIPNRPSITGAYGLVSQISPTRVRKIAKAIYQRLGTHNGIIHCFKVHDRSTELALAKQGNLEQYILTHPAAPSVERRRLWIQELAEAFGHVHERRVVPQDVALRNILVHNDSLKLCDFGDSVLLPLESDMACFSVGGGVTPQVEIARVGCVFYSVAVWRVFECHFDDGEGDDDDDGNGKVFSQTELLDVSTDGGVLFASAIEKCWGRGYASMEALRREVLDS
ncbi:hypothetical protein AJ79_05759 [Helicocarpus griseus UAMH5409]|uniref:Protein kinase domain-containing protein n=1 Tax=Helicocarpus griseus UAMH5409 TaxID=1447875 RepID=A0A2B7XJD1_9EURO|nr:hypothetical protein AJ79_05759 [Helicocarpus griseus UAMH5409]